MSIFVGDVILKLFYNFSCLSTLSYDDIIVFFFAEKRFLFSMVNVGSVFLVQGETNHVVQNYIL